MAIFSRRILQRIINENARILSDGQLRSHIKRLNRMHKTLELGDEWEVVLLNAFSKVGRVTHEEGLAGTSDLYFEAHDDPSNKFLADITAVSDEGFKKFGDFDKLYEELRKRVEERGFNPAHFHLDVQGNHQEIQRGRYGEAVKARLYMPADKSSFESDIFNEDWERFLDEVTGSSQPAAYSVYRPEQQLSLAISYKPGERYGAGSHLAHKQINHLTSNRIYGELTKKAKQLAKAKFGGHRGIIICDGGYTPFHSMNHFSGYPVEKVIKYFLKNNPSISFVFTIVIKRDSYPRVPNMIITRSYANGLTADGAKIFESIDRAIDFLPQPESDAFNALNHLKSKNGREGRKNGALTMSSNEIRMSSRTLMELLSGRMTHEDFMSRYENISSGFRTPGYTNFFDMKLRNGMMISDITIVPSDTKDDDVISIKWSGPDPAISRFVPSE